MMAMWLAKNGVYGQVLKRLPTLKKLDGVPIDPEEREAAKSA